MQKETSVLKNHPVSFKILAEWDIESAVYFTKKLYQYVNQGKLSFELKARNGSVSTEFLITIFGGVASAIIYDLIKEIFLTLKKNKLNNKEIKPVYVFTKETEYIITGDKDSKIPDELKDELFDN